MPTWSRHDSWLTAEAHNLALITGDYAPAPSVDDLRTTLLCALCRQYVAPDSFDLIKVARVNVALAHLRDRIFATEHLVQVIWCALPRPLTDSLFHALGFPLNTPMTGAHVPEHLRGAWNDLSYALTQAYVPDCGALGSLAFLKTEDRNYTAIANGLANDPDAYINAVKDAWGSRGIDLNPPSAHRMGGLMP